MSIKKEELEKELKHLEETKEVIDRTISSKKVDIESYKSNIVNQKRFLWEHQSEYYDGDLYSEMSEHDFSVGLINEDIKKVYKLYRAKETPYFSRIDFTSEGENDTFYIGITGVDEDYEPVVYDWRAPIANLYYNYGVGPSKYEIPDATISGETTLKRQFDIKMGKLENVYDSGIDTRDEMLIDVLENNTSEQMRNIVHTIQKEQNEIIRYGGSSSLIVEGVAGSGKTSVALHRVAYLLYNQIGLQNNNVLILSPNVVFSNYISNVLPELGEENVLTTTFDDFASAYIKGAKPESIMEFVERHYEEDKSEERGASKEDKMTYRERLDCFLNEYYDSLKFRKKMGLKTKFLSSAELDELKRDVPSKLRINARFDYLAERICAKFDIDQVKNAHKMKEKIMDILGVIKDPLKLYEEFSHKIISGIVPYEDIFAIIYIYFEVWGYPSFSNIKVVVIDEAQDYSMWQFEFLKRIFNQAVFTILGDKNQRVNPYIKYDSMEKIAEVFRDSKYKKLFNTYRSSKEIIEYSNKILGLEGINSIRPSNGQKVSEKESDNLAHDIEVELERFRGLGYKRLAVVTKTKVEAEKLKKSIDNEADFIPVYLAKGLEYDGVIVASEKSKGFTADESNLFYVASTRALHILTVFNKN